MRMSEAFPSRFLKADDDITEGGVTLAIKNVEIEKVGDDNKPVIAFRGIDKRLVCNKTNAKVIAKLYGDDTDDWVGQKITLYATDVEFQGDVMRGLRVKTRKPTGNAVTTQAALMALVEAARAAETGDDDGDDEGEAPAEKPAKGAAKARADKDAEHINAMLSDDPPIF